MNDSFEETLLQFIGDVEEDGTNLKEEAAHIDFYLEQRPDVIISITIMDRSIEDEVMSDHSEIH